MQFIVLFVVLALQAIETRQGCPNVPVVTPLDINQFTGTWYQQESKNTFFFQGPGTCVKAEYSLDDVNKVVNVVNSQIVKLIGEVSIKGTATLKDAATKAGILKVTLQTPVGPQTAELLVLFTDYKNVAILYSCRLSVVSAWVLTRKQTLGENEKKLIDNAFKEINKNKDTPKREEFKPTDQTNC